MNVLNKIIRHKKNEISHLKLNYSTSQLESSLFFDRETISLKSKLKSSSSGIIAEHKRKSPSKDIINNKLKIQEVISGYQDAGVCGISVLTDFDFFGGTNDDLKIAREIFEGPILRKDFILDEWQIYESYFFGADCILLILAILEDKEAKRFYEVSKELNLDVIVEVHDESELKRAIDLKVNCIGINNRNLKTLKIDLDTFKRLSKKIPKGIIKICESGLKSNKQLKDFTNMGADGFLIGEYLMSSENLKKKTIEIIKNEF